MDSSAPAMSTWVLLTTVGIAVGLQAGAHDILSEEWRRRLLASGMTERHVRMMASDVAQARELCEDTRSPTSKLFIAAKVRLFLLGILVVVYGALVRGETWTGTAVICGYGAVTLLGVAVLVRVDYRCWWAKQVMEGAVIFFSNPCSHVSERVNQSNIVYI
jgi:hypothetical protein